MEFNEIQRGDKFLVAPNDFFMEVLDEIPQGFLVKVTSPENEESLKEFTQKTYEKVKKNLFKLPKLRSES